MRIVRLVCVFALALCLASAVYAETQSIKISGDLAIRSINRGDYDLDKNHAEAAATRADNSDDWQNYFMSTTEVQIDADLTDNVAGVIRLYNQRDWDVRTKTETATSNPSTDYVANADEFDVGVNLAYIELKEFLYSPLTLRIGCQNLWFGKGFIVGAHFINPTASINATEYSCQKSFDAIRATLDYDPWTIDVIASKIWENAIGSNDDVDLYGVNVGYIFDVYNAEAEGYYFLKADRGLESWNIDDLNSVHTMGIRGSMDPIENWTVAAESALQLGKYVGSKSATQGRERCAWAIDASLECRYFTDKFAWKPIVAAEYIYYSGDKKTSTEDVNSEGVYNGWDIMYRGKFDSAIREFQGLFYTTNQDVNNQRTNMLPRYPDAADSNQHQVVVAGSIQPTDSLMVEARYINFWQQYATYHYDPAHTGTGVDERIKDKKYLGSEIDVQAAWDYTEDVQFGLLCAWYFPGAHYYDQSDDVATDIVGTVKLSF
ncbi:MAG: alginate export family protein [Candidatus Omnitrophota bacterium]